MNRKALLKTKLILLMVFGLYVVSFIVVNSTYTSKVWFLPGVHPELSIAVVIGVTMGITLLLTWFGRQLMRTIRDLRKADKPDADKQPADDKANQDQG